MKKQGLITMAVLLLTAIVCCCAVGCGIAGTDGLSAYEIAVRNGFVGTEAQWIDSLSQAESAYDVAVRNGFTGSEQEWLQSLKGSNGQDGQDAPAITIQQLYRAAQDEGYQGSFLDFIQEYLDDNTYEAVSTEAMAGEAVLSCVSIMCSFTKTTYQSGWGIWGGGTQEKEESYQSAGAGVIYRLDAETGDAYIITNYHVVYDNDSNTTDKISNDIQLALYGAQAITKDQTTGLYRYTQGIPATYIGGSMTYDIAVLKVTGSEALRTGVAHSVTVGDSTQVCIGATAIAIGNPEALGMSVTEGIISVDSETITMTGADDQTQIAFRVMRMDTAVNGGNSGGGLFDAYGNLIGIVNAKIVQSDVDNIAYAIPVNIARYVADGIIERYEASGSVQPMQKCLLGVTLTAAQSSAHYDQDMRRTYIVEQVTVASVNPGSLADGILQEGDILQSISLRGQTFAVTRTYVAVDAMLLARVGDTVQLTVLRDGQTITKTLEVTPSALSIIA